MKILILEDDKIRQAYFIKHLEGHEIYIVDNSKDCIEQLQKHWNYLFLDHDLGNDTDSGYVVAQWLHKKNNNLPDEIIIHSLNPVGAKRMHQLLPMAKIVPFNSKLLK